MPTHCPATPLAHSRLQVEITDLVAEYTLHHHFRNTGTDAIEAVYSFPVPLDAAFMGMRAVLAGEQRVADITPRAQATRRYDDAIAEGDSAVLLEELEPGMLCVNLGNLKPGEDGEIELRFAAALASADGLARFSLPLVHRPRYGRIWLDDPGAPANDFAIEHPLEAEIRVHGQLAGVPVSCASHGARFSHDGNSRVLQLNRAMLDRDLVLSFELPRRSAGQGRLVRDGEHSIAMLSLAPEVAIDTSRSGDICLLLDCSGSMRGDAIQQSRAALHAVADALHEDDHIQVLRFGSDIVPMFRRPLRAGSRVRDALHTLADTVNADLGGTEMGSALKAALRALQTLDQQAERQQSIILVTDGAVLAEQIAQVQAEAEAAGVRVFIVAVGSSAGAEVLAPLAKRTRGVLERAVPAEPIDEAVSRQFRRARQPGPLQIEVDWMHAQAKPLPLAPVYAGDACTAIALLPDTQGCAPRVHVQGLPAPLEFVLDHLETAPALRAIAGLHAWHHAEPEHRQAIALQYGLVTDETAAVLVHPRAEDDKADGLPWITPVTHMWPDGMGTSPPAMIRRAGDAAPLACFSVSSPEFDTPHPRRADPTPPRPVLEALLRALITHSDQAMRGELELATLLDALPPDMRTDAKGFMQALGIDRDRLTHHHITHLAETLAQRLPRIALDDDQEATLAMLAAGFQQTAYHNG